MKAEAKKDPITGETIITFRYSWYDICGLKLDELDKAILNLESNKPSDWALQLETIFRKAGM